MESHCPQALDGLLNRFYVEIRKKDGTDYEPDSLRVMQAAIDRYLCHKNYPASIITGREFTKSQETLDAKAKQLRSQRKGERLNKAQAYSETDEAISWREGKLGNHSGLALANVNFKNLSETMRFRGRQDHYDAHACRRFQHFPDGRREQGGRVQRISDENETRRADKPNPPLSSADVVDGRRRDRSREIV